MTYRQQTPKGFGWVVVWMAAMIALLFLLFVSLCRDAQGAVSFRSFPTAKTDGHNLSFRSWQQIEEEKPRRPDRLRWERPKRLMYFFDQSDRDSNAINTECLPWLQESGWEVGPGPGAHIQKVEVNYRPDIRRTYNLTRVPAFLLIEDGEETRRHEGPLRRMEIVEFYGGGTADVSLGKENDPEPAVPPSLRQSPSPRAAYGRGGYAGGAASPGFQCGVVRVEPGYAVAPGRIYPLGGAPRAVCYG